jgi:hypothetical protein|tara:strand:+ start:1301 stop:1879 length:579 start_codon:yes stop_codon:yes gene_type:complete
MPRRLCLRLKAGNTHSPHRRFGVIHFSSDVIARPIRAKNRAMIRKFRPQANSPTFEKSPFFFRFSLTLTLARPLLRRIRPPGDPLNRIGNRRTWNLLSDKTTDHIVCWNSDGKSFTVKQPELLSAVLPKRLGVFHETYAGFLRELSLYGFRCVGNDSYGVPVSFTVTNFERGKFENLGLVKRKGNYGRSRRT